MSSRLALIAMLTLSLAACEGTGLPGLGTDEQPQVEGHKGPPGVSPLEAPIETGAGARAVSTAEAKTYNTTAFSARGNEPFWAVDAAGGTAIYKTPDNQKGRAVRVSRLNFAEGVEYIGVLNGRPFVLTVRGRECQDSMSGEKFPMSAELKVSGRTNRGCAAPASAELAAAVAAVKAPAPGQPKPKRVAAPKPTAAEPAPTTRPAASTPAPPAPATSQPTEPEPASTEPASDAPGSVTPPANDTSAQPEPATPATGTSGDAAPDDASPVPDLPMRLPQTPPTVTQDAADTGTGATEDSPSETGDE